MLTAGIISFVSAFIITYFNVSSTEKFHNYFFLLKNNVTFILFCLLYGLIGVGLLYILKDGANLIEITEDNTKLGNYLYPVAVGVSTKGVSDLNFFNIKTGGSAIPVGIRTFTQPLDKFFEEKFDGVCFKKSKKYLQPYFAKYQLTTGQTIEMFKTKTIGDLIKHHPDTKKINTLIAGNQFTSVTTTDEFLVLVLRELGPTVFKSVFPL